jgi:glycosyltransferase involved in cell wall biosynthesis
LLPPLSALVKTFSASEAGGYLLQPDFPLSAEISKLMGEHRAADVELAFIYPPHYPRLRGKLKVGMLTYESSALPAEWTRHINAHLDLLLAPSEFCKRIFIDSGVKTPVNVVPYGCSPEKFSPRQTVANDSNVRRFFYIGTPHRRKGVADLVRAFREEFHAGESAELLLKLNYLPKNPKAWEISERELSELIAGDQRVKLFVESSDDEKLSEWYHRGDVFVIPSYSEGFGLAHLEAAFCGKPIICGGWGAHREFLPSDAAIFLPYELRPARELQYDAPELDGLIAFPDFARLKSALRFAFENSGEMITMAERAHRAVSALTWENSARQTLAAIMRLVEG